MNTLIVLTYVILLLVFLVSSALILRHTMKFSYLSPRFKTIVSIFGLLALIVIVFSVYLVLLLGRSSPPSSSPSIPSPTSSSSDINF